MPVAACGYDDPAAMKLPESLMEEVEGLDPAALAGAPPRRLELGCVTVSLPNHWFWKWRGEHNGLGRVQMFSGQYPRLKPRPHYADGPETRYEVEDGAIILHLDPSDPVPAWAGLVEDLPVHYIQLRLLPDAPPCSEAKGVSWRPGGPAFSARFDESRPGRPPDIRRAYRRLGNGLRVVYAWDLSRTPPDRWNALDSRVGEIVMKLIQDPES